MSDECPIVNADGLYIPEPVVVAIINLSYEGIGRMIRNMVEWTHRLGECRSTVEGMDVPEAIVKSMWREMIRQEYEGGITLTREVADKGRTNGEE